MASNTFGYASASSVEIDKTNNDAIKAAIIYVI